MELIIDIPKDVYERIREYYEKNDTVESTYSYIYHGTPIPDDATVCDIEQIRTEISALPVWKFSQKEVLQIIDKHTK